MCSHDKLVSLKCAPDAGENAVVDVVRLHSNNAGWVERLTPTYTTLQNIPTTMQIPRGILNFARIWMLQKDRDEATFKALTDSLCFYALKNKLDLDDPSVVIHFVALHVFSDVEVEVQAFNSLINNRDRYAKYARYKMWKDFSMLETRHRVAGVAGFAVLAYSVGLERWKDLLGSMMYRYRITSLAFLLLIMRKDVLSVLGWLLTKRTTRQVQTHIPEEPTFEQNVYSACKSFVGWFTNRQGTTDELENTSDGQVTLLLENTAETVVVEELVDESTFIPLTGMSTGFDPNDASCDNIYIPEVDDALLLTGGRKCELYTVAPKMQKEVRKFDCLTRDYLIKIRGTDQVHQLGHMSIMSVVKPHFLGRNKNVRFDGLDFEGKPNPLQRGITCQYNANPNAKKRKPQPYFLIGPAWVGIMPAAHEDNERNEKISLHNRHLRINAGGNKRQFLNAANIALKLLDLKPTPNITLESWILSQPPAKQTTYAGLLNQRTEMNFRADKYHKRNFFIKREILVPGYNKRIDEKAPRGIQGLDHPAINMVLGPFMQRVQTTMKMNQTPPYSQLSYTSGATPDVVGAWYHHMKQAGYNFYEDDFSSYDATQGEGAHECEMALYKLFMPDHAVYNALERQKLTEGYGKYHKYTCPYTRKSGDQNTSIGNTFINFSVHCWALDQLNVSDFYMLALGDDNLLAVKGEDDKFATKVGNLIKKTFGLEPKLSKCKYPSYCSAMFAPVNTNDGEATHLLVPEVIRHVSKLGWTVSDLKHNEECIDRLRGNEQSNMTNSVMPISRIFNAYYTDDEKIGTPEDAYRSHRGMTICNFETSESTYEWFTHCYGLTPSEICELEAFIAGHLVDSEGKPSAWDHPLMHKMYAYRNLSSTS